MRKTLKLSLLLTLVTGLCACTQTPEPEATPEIALTPEVTIEPEPTPTAPPVPTPPVLERFKDIYAENPDFVGCLTVPGTVIEYPIVQSTDNEFYLDHDYYGEPSVAGANFMEMYADLLELNQSLCLYGHCMKDGSMFAGLHRYKSLEYYINNPYFQFDSLYEENSYVIFGVFYMAGNMSDELFYDYAVPGFGTREGFQRHIDEIRYRSIFVTPVDVTTDDSLVLLSTCTYETDDLRLVIAGRRLREGETEDFDMSASRLNTNPLYPQKWYDELGGEPPEYYN